MQSEVSKAMFGSMVCFFVGMHLILQAKRIRRYVVRGFERHETLYRMLLFGDWVLSHPRAHIVLIRTVGVLFVGMALLVAFLVFGTP